MRQGTDQSQITLNKSGFDVAGRLTASTNALDHVTSYSDTTTSRTTTFPNSTTHIEESYQDGKPKKVSGTAVHGVRYEYGVESGSFFTKEITLNTDGSDTSEWVKTYTDMVGRTFKTEYADSATAQSYFNNKGQLIKQVDPDGVTTLFSYNAKGSALGSTLYYLHLTTRGLSLFCPHDTTAARRV